MLSYLQVEDAGARSASQALLCSPASSHSNISSMALQLHQLANLCQMPAPCSANLCQPGAVTTGVPNRTHVLLMAGTQAQITSAPYRVPLDTSSMCSLAAELRSVHVCPKAPLQRCSMLQLTGRLQLAVLSTARAVMQAQASGRIVASVWHRTIIASRLHRALASVCPCQALRRVTQMLPLPLLGTVDGGAATATDQQRQLASSRQSAGAQRGMSPLMQRHSKVCCTLANLVHMLLLVAFTFTMLTQCGLHGQRTATDKRPHRVGLPSNSVSGSCGARVQVRRHPASAATRQVTLLQQSSLAPNAASMWQPRPQLPRCCRLSKAHRRRLHLQQRQTSHSPPMVQTTLCALALCSVHRRLQF